MPAERDKYLEERRRVEQQQRLVKADTVHFSRDAFRQLFMEDGIATFGPVVVKRAFPLTDPERFVVVQTTDGQFVAVLDDLGSLDPDSRQLVQDELDRSNFLPKITRIVKIEDKFNVMLWTVETDRGPRTFEVVSRKNDIRWLSDNHIVVEDADGNRFEIENLSALDEASREKVEIEI